MFLVRAELPRRFWHLPGPLLGRAGQEAEDGREARLVRTGAFQPFLGLMLAQSGASVFSALTGKGWPCAAATPTFCPQGPATVGLRPLPWRARQAPGWARTSPAAHPAQTAEDSCGPVSRGRLSPKEHTVT